MLRTPPHDNGQSPNEDNSTSAGTISGNDDVLITQPSIRSTISQTFPPDVEISAASIKLPQFWVNCPEAWFIHTEMQFATRGILQDKTKYEYVVTALPQEVIMTVIDVIQNPPNDDRYGNLKDVLINRHTISETRRLDKIFSDSEIGDQRPSEFYRSMALLAGTKISQDVLIKLWVRKLPKSLNVALTGSNITDVNKLLQLADNIWDVLQRDELAVVSIPTSKQVPNIDKVVDGLVQATANLCEGFRSLSLDVSAMRQQFEGYRNRGQKEHFGRERSRSRNRSKERNWLCRFHYRYGKDARKCEQPCSYSERNSTN